MAYFLAVDAGGSKTEFLLSEGLRELGRARTGTIKRSNADESVAEKNLEEALTELARVTGLSMKEVSRTCIGTSGNTVPLVTDWLREAFQRRVAGLVLVVGDVEIALDAAFPSGRGVLVLSGTGSNVAARDRHGKIMTAGGWGPMLADQGAGHWIGMEALRRGFLARDEQRETGLLEAARKLWNLPTIDVLIEFANVQPAVRYASKLAPAVVACAASGDEVAIEILEKGGRDLAYLAALLIERMRAIEGERFELPTVAFAGSIMANVEGIRNSLKRALRERYAEIEFIEQAVDPVRGALWRVMQAG
jgi:N-acetylglucosamine kinase-like BadF-type ATPase